MAQEGLPTAPQAEDPREATAAECQAALSAASAKVKAAKRALREPIVVHRPRLDAPGKCVGWGEGSAVTLCWVFMGKCVRREI